MRVYVKINFRKAYSYGEKGGRKMRGGGEIWCVCVGGETGMYWGFRNNCPEKFLAGIFNRTLYQHRKNLLIRTGYLPCVPSNCLPLWRKGSPKFVLTTKSWSDNFMILFRYEYMNHQNLGLYSFFKPYII